MKRQCPHCKAEATLEDAHCPRCNLPFAPLSADNEDARTFTTWATVTALLTGFLITVVGIVLMIVARASEDGVMEARFRILLWLGAAVMLAATVVLVINHKKQK